MNITGAISSIGRASAVWRAAEGVAAVTTFHRSDAEAYAVGQALDGAGD